MKRLHALLGLSAIASLSTASMGQMNWVDRGPAIGEPMPAIDMFDADGNPFNTSRLKGKHTVIVFGCLT